ncbi:MAG: hypothetical protein KC502_20205 [Myxococcales bacterium]|nr:hypothetical protein [Myxococcales bacterium]
MGQRIVTVAATIVLSLGLVACQGHQDGASPTPFNAKAQAAKKKFPVKLRPRTAGPGSGIQTQLTDFQGKPIKAPCGSCHATKAESRRRKDGNSLKKFHNGLTLKHGNLTCLTCHNGDDYDTLRLADDTPVKFDKLMDLCGQCHGPQKRDYDNGSHGGMSGYWDLTKGPRTRNQCVHCHDPHAPAYVGVVPAPGPRDRFLKQPVAPSGAAAHP